jgi:hypothetical protein
MRNMKRFSIASNTSSIRSDGQDMIKGCHIFCGVAFDK